MDADPGHDHPFLTRYYDLLGAGDIDGAAALYEPDAEIVRYDGVADTPAEIHEYLTAFIGRHPGFALRSIVALREADDVLMWDALIDTDEGILQTVNVVMFGDDGLVRRHIPGVRGYWGR